MSRLFLIGSAFSVSLLFLVFFQKNPAPVSNQLQADAPPDSIRAMANYVTYCGGCHGEKMDAFVDRTWKHGSGRQDLFHAIKVGYPDEGMPGFDSAFTDEEIYELSDFMLKSIVRLKAYQFEGQEAKSAYFASKHQAVRLDTILSGMRSIWGMGFLPDGSIIATEKFGKLYRVDKKKVSHEIAGVPTVLSDNQGGLMDILVHPAFKTNKLIYLSYSAPKKEDGNTVATTVIFRARLEGDKLVDGKVIFEAFPYLRAKHHYGSRMVFGRDGMLYFSVGERGNEKENPQQLANDLGKIHRVREDGSIPADNPFVNTPGARPSIWSYGHRNPQGLAVHPATGEIWSTEHGPRGGDEINIIKKGANYGWPLITYGINYNGKIVSKNTALPGLEQPIKYWIPSIGPSGMAFVSGKKYGKWEGELISGSLRFKYLNLSMLKNKEVIAEEMLLKNLGRLRDVRMGPDGYIYVAVETPGAIYRLLPVR